MTNHIEELMKAAEVSKYRLFRQYNYAQVLHGEKELQKSKDAGMECVDVRNCKDNDCIYWNELYYPKFTPAKQLELIKLILKKPYIEWEQYFENNKFIMKADMPDETYACLTIDVENTEYALALAEFITELLKIKRLDKSEVKRILEDAN